MKITHNNINDNGDHHMVDLVLSNGDKVEIYDNIEGYGHVEVIRHDYNIKSDVTTKTSRAIKLDGFRNTLTKDRAIEIKSDNLPNGDRRRTQLELTHFYQKHTDKKGAKK